MRWNDFAEACPELAALGEERFRARELCLLGTLRRNGWPRITPVEPDFVDGELMSGMMWRSPKALDLLRDPRCVVHSVVSRRDGDEGDFKLYARARQIDDSDVRARYRATIKERIDWSRPSRTTTCSRSTSTRRDSSPSTPSTATAWPGTPTAASAAGSNERANGRAGTASTVGVASERLRGFRGAPVRARWIRRGP
jgi:hypothetical protein